LSHGGARHSALGAAILAACTAGSAIGADGDDLRHAVSLCAAVTKPDDRLACYDRLAGRPAAVLAAPLTPHAALSTATPVPAPTVARPPAPVEDFGLSATQKTPVTSEIQAITAAVTAVGHGSNGRVLVGLDNGESWEIEDSPDALLSVGDTVKIRRASLGSFLMVTPAKLSHRVRRIK
jgi:hypothetical protein